MRFPLHISPRRWLLAAVLERLDAMSAQQDELNTLVAEQGAALAALGESLTGIDGDLDVIIAKLDAAVAANEPLDFEPLRALKATTAALAERAAAIDSENPAPVVEPPVEPTV